MSATTQVPKAVLKMPSSIGDQIIRVTDIKGKLTANATFPTGWTAGTLTQTQFNSDVQAFLDAETAVNAKTPGAVSLRDEAFITLKLSCYGFFKFVSHLFLFQNYTFIYKRGHLPLI